MAMTTEKLVELIEEKASANVDAKIRCFCEAVRNALVEVGILRQTDLAYRLGGVWNKDCEDMLKAVISNGLKPSGSGWPTKLWDVERNEITSKVLGQFDIVQQLTHVSLAQKDQDHAEPIQPETETKKESGAA